MSTEPRLSVVIPAYNEEFRIGKTLELISKYLEQQPYTWEIIVVDDCSSDRTAQRVQDFSSAGVRLLEQKPNAGKGAAVRRGMLEARGEYVLFCDADNATPFEEIEKFWPFVADFPVIIGSRYLKESRVVVQQPLVRRLLSRVGNLLVQVMLLPGYPDTQCGFKLFSAAAADHIFNKLTLERWGFDMEILAIAKLKHLAVKQVPVNWLDQTNSKIQSSSVFARTLLELFKIRWNLIKGAYR